MKITKPALQEKMDLLKFVHNDSSGAISAHEILQSIVRIENRGTDLIRALSGDLNHHAKKLAIDCEALIDKSTKILLVLNNKYEQKVK